MTPPRGRGLFPGAAIPPPHLAVLAILLVHALGHFFYMGIWRTVAAPDFDVNDFKAYYTAGLALRTGEAERFLYSDPQRLNLGVLPPQPWVDFAVERGIPHPSAYIYPPFFAVMMAPLTLLPYHAANLAWFTLNVLLLAGSAALLALLPLGGQRQDEGRPLAAAAVLLSCLHFFPTVRALQCGQAGLVMLFLLALSLRVLLANGEGAAAGRRRDALAGTALGLAAAIKLTPLLLIVWLVQAGRRRAALWGGGAFLLLTALSAAVAGWSNLVLFVTGFLPALSRGAATWANQSLNGFLNRLFTSTTVTLFDFSDEPAIVRWLARGAAVLLCGAALWLGGAGGPEGEQGARRRIAMGFGLITLTTLIISPISWEHHYVLALIPIAVMIHEIAARGTFRQALLLAGAYALMAVDAFESIRKNLGLPDGLARLALSYVLLGALLLWLLTASRLFPRGREA